jgi:hypothetical protein
MKFRVKYEMKQKVLFVEAFWAGNRYEWLTVVYKVRFGIFGVEPSGFST